MKKLITTVAIALGFCMIPCGSELIAQEYKAPEVTLSKETVKLDGKIYYSHIVLEKQTLYSISKAYGVTIDEIYEANRNLKETGLKKNAIILIPANDKAATAVRKEEKVIVNDDTAKEETAKEEAEKPSFREEKREKKEDGRKGKTPDYFIHTVKWYENLNDIAEKYGMTVESLMQYNSLKDRKLTRRQKLRIPTEPQNFIPEETVPENPVDTLQESAGRDEGPAALFTPRNNLNFVLMLPFNVSSEKHSEGVMDFYSGALIAARELGKKGINIEMSVYDGATSHLPITSSRLEESDLAIGPIASSGLQEMLAKSPENKFVVSPLDHRADTLADRHPNFIQVPTSSAAQYEDAIEWIREDLQAGDKVIVFYEKGVDFPVVRNNLSRLDNHESFSYNILEGRDVMTALTEKLTETGENRVLIASESEAFVNDVIRNLNLLIHSKYKVTLYGAAKIRSFDTIDIDNLHNTKYHSSLSYYIDYEKPEVMNFLMEYRALCGTEPTPFAFQGYDTLKYFGTLCSQYGDRWPEYLQSERQEMLQSGFKFKVRTKEDGTNGGYVNTAIRRIVYGKDYSVTPQGGI